MTLNNAEKILMRVLLVESGYEREAGLWGRRVCEKRVQPKVGGCFEREKECKRKCA